MHAPRLLLIDDHAMFCTGLGLVIKSALPEAEVYEARTLEQALAVRSDRMDAVLLDIQLDGLNGLECIAVLRRRWVALPVLVLSAHDDPQSMRLALARGASAFVSKGESAHHIVDALQRMLLGERTTRGGAAPAPRSLTPRQCEVIELLHRGLTNKLIARKLSLSDNTVRRHVQDILAFFQVGTRAEAVFVARRQGLLD